MIIIHGQIFVKRIEHNNSIPPHPASSASFVSSEMNFPDELQRFVKAAGPRASAVRGGFFSVKMPWGAICASGSRERYIFEKYRYIFELKTQEVNVILVQKGGERSQ